MTKHLSRRELAAPVSTLVAGRSVVAARLGKGTNGRRKRLG